MSLLLGHAALAATLFLLALVGLRPGGRRWYLDLLLVAVWVLILVWIGLTYGVKAGAIAAGMSVLYGAVMLPLAAPTARALYGPEPPDAWRGPDVPSERLRHISAVLAQTQDAAALEALLDLCEGNPVIQATMSRYGATRDTLAQLYLRLVTGGTAVWAGVHYLPASAIADADALAWLLGPSSSEPESERAALSAYFEWAAPLPDRERSAG